MGPPGRTLAVAVYRPLAEQLAALAAVQAGQRVLELSEGDGELTRALLAAGLAPRSVLCVVADERRRATLHAELDDSPVRVVVAPPPPALFEFEGFDVALSLFGVGADRLPPVLDLIKRGADRAILALWTDGAAHENALRDAWRDVAGDVAGLPPLDQLPRLPRKWSTRPLGDVARFDSVDQLWAALVDERGVAVPAGAAPALRARLAHHAGPFTAADGTLRIPVRATLVEVR